MKRLGRKDATSTALVVVGMAMALSVTQGWNWPLLGGVREGVSALGIAGAAACAFGTPLERSYFSDPFGLIALMAAMLAIGVGIVGGLITGSLQYLIVLMVVVPMLWALATFRHSVEGSGSSQFKTAA